MADLPSNEVPSWVNIQGRAFTKHTMKNTKRTLENLLAEGLYTSTAASSIQASNNSIAISPMLTRFSTPTASSTIGILQGNHNGQSGIFISSDVNSWSCSLPGHCCHTYLHDWNLVCSRWGASNATHAAGIAETPSWCDISIKKGSQWGASFLMHINKSKKRLMCGWIVACLLALPVMPGQTLRTSLSLM